MKQAEYFLFTGDEYTRICGTKSVKCYQDAEHRLFGEDIYSGMSDMDAKSFRLRCDCLSGCTNIEYDVEIDRAELRWEEWSNSINIPNYNHEEYDLTKLS